MLKKITALMLAASVIIIAAAAVRSFSSSWTKRFPPKKTEPKQTEAPAPIEKKNIELLPYSDTRLITSEKAAAESSFFTIICPENELARRITPCILRHRYWSCHVG